MANPYTCIFNIRVGGVFSGEIDLIDVKKKIKIIMEKNDFDFDFDLDNCLSKELTGTKVSYITIAGGWSYLNYEDCKNFAICLLKEFAADIFFIFWDEINGEPIMKYLSPHSNDIIGKINRSF